MAGHTGQTRAGTVPCGPAAAETAIVCSIDDPPYCRARTGTPSPNDLQRGDRETIGVAAHERQTPAAQRLIETDRERIAPCRRAGWDREGVAIPNDFARDPTRCRGRAIEGDRVILAVNLAVGSDEVREDLVVLIDHRHGAPEEGQLDLSPRSERASRLRLDAIADEIDCSAKGRPERVRHRGNGEIVRAAHHGHGRTDVNTTVGYAAAF